MTEWAPRPSVASITAATVGASTGTAPDSAARALRPATGSTASTRPAPRAMAERTAQSPTAPRPSTTTVPPGGVSARLAPIQPVFRLSVSNRPASSPTPSGMASIWKSAKGTATGGLAGTERPGSEHLGAVHAGHRVTGGAAVTAAATGHRRRQHPVADGEPLHRPAHLDHRADELVAHGQPVAHRDVAVVEVEVRTADGAGLDGHHRPVGPGWDGVRHLHDAHPTRPFDAHLEHCGPPTR